MIAHTIAFALRHSLVEPTFFHPRHLDSLRMLKRAHTTLLGRFSVSRTVPSSPPLQISHCINNMTSTGALDIERPDIRSAHTTSNSKPSFSSPTQRIPHTRLIPLARTGRDRRIALPAAVHPALAVRRPAKRLAAERYPRRSVPSAFTTLAALTAPRRAILAQAQTAACRRL